MKSSAFPSKLKIMKIPSLITFCTVLLVGVAVIYGATNALGKTDEKKTPTTDLWLNAKSQIALIADGRIKERQLEVEITKGVVLLRRSVNSDVAEDAAKEFDGVKSVKNDPEVVAPPRREAVDDSEDSTALEARERAAKFRSLHGNRSKLMFITSMYLSLMKP